MGYFKNIIADSRLFVQAATPVRVTGTVLPGLPPDSQPSPWQVDPMRPLPTDAPWVPHVAEAPAAPGSQSAEPTATPISPPAPQTSRAAAIEAVGTQHHTTTIQAGATSSAPLPPRPSAPATLRGVLPAVQRQSSALDIAATPPPVSPAPSPPERHAIDRAVPDSQRPPHQDIEAVQTTTRSGPTTATSASEVVASPPPAAPEAAVSNVVNGESAVPRHYEAHAPATPWRPPPRSRTPQHESQPTVSRAPQVRIGQVNVIVEAPAAPPPQPPITQTGPLSSRLFLRSL
jgi:hypothetical protein